MSFESYKIGCVDFNVIDGAYFIDNYNCCTKLVNEDYVRIDCNDEICANFEFSNYVSFVNKIPLSAQKMTYDTTFCYQSLGYYLDANLAPFQATGGFLFSNNIILVGSNCSEIAIANKDLTLNIFINPPNSQINSEVLLFKSNENPDEIVFYSVLQEWILSELYFENGVIKILKVENNMIIDECEISLDDKILKVDISKMKAVK